MARYLSSEVQIIVALMIAATTLVRAWIAYRLAAAREHGRTDRLNTAIGGTAPQQRPEIIRACSELEAGVSQAETRSNRRRASRRSGDPS